MDPAHGPDSRAFRDRPQVEWVRAWAPPAVAAASSAVLFAGIAVWVLAGHLPSLLADALFVFAVVVVIRERAAFTDPEDCTGMGVSVLGFGWTTVVACGLVVSTQRSTWVWGAPVAWWVHVLVGLGLLAFAGAVSFAAVLVCFLVSEDAAFLGASWAVLVGAAVGFTALWIGGAGIWVGMLCGGAAALLVGPALTALLRVRLVPVVTDTDWDALLG